MSKQQRSGGKATAVQKADAHAALDVLWQSTAFKEEDRQILRSLIYQQFAAVCLGQQKNFTVEGILNPRAGGTHISKLPEKYHQTLKDFLRHILFDVNKGNTTRLTSWLVRWINPINKIKNDAQGKKEERVQQHIEKDPIISSIRDLLGFGKGVKVVEMTSEAAAATKAAAPAAIAPEKSAAIVATEPKKLPKMPSMKEIFIDGLYLAILGKEDEAMKLYQQAEKMGYQESASVAGKEQKILSPEEQEIKNLVYGMIFDYLFFQKKNFKTAFEYTERMANLKVPDALYNAAVYYAKKHQKSHNQEDKNNADYFIKEAADCGHAKAQNLMGVYKLRENNAKSKKEAEEYFKKASDQGYIDSRGFADSTRFLIDLYSQGNRIEGHRYEKNLDLTIKYFRLCMDQEGVDQSVLKKEITRPIKDEGEFKQVDEILKKKEREWYEKKDDDQQKLVVIIKLRLWCEEYRQQKEKEKEVPKKELPTIANDKEFKVKSDLLVKMKEKLAAENDGKRKEVLEKQIKDLTAQCAAYREKNQANAASVNASIAAPSQAPNPAPLVAAASAVAPKQNTNSLNS
jgi:hypothetical protein